jgi:hypothetical protein
MNRDKCNNNRILRNCDSRKTHKSGCKINTTQFTNVATGQNKFPTAAQLISSVPRQIATPELPKGEQPKLTNLPDNTLPYQNFI